jgi:sn-glycerol 3-phosphate transport system ATP-binding protein
VFERPANTYVAGFIGAPSMNMLPATLGHGGTAATTAFGVVIPFADGRRAGEDGRGLILGVRPEHVALDPAGVVLQIDLIEPLGSETVVIGRLPDGDLLSVKLPGAAPAADTIGISVPPDQLHVFDAATGLRLEGSAP